MSSPNDRRSNIGPQLNAPRRSAKPQRWSQSDRDHVLPDSGGKGAGDGAKEKEAEDDYMSEEFLRRLDNEFTASGDSKCMTYSQRRARTVREQRERGHIKPLHEREQESLEKGLATKIGRDNKGFAMLAKMGFKEGMTIGKSNDGLSEPLPIQKKFGKSGIGVFAPKRKRLGDEAEEATEEGLEDTDPSAFRSRTHARFTAQRILADICRCRKACEHLDTAAGINDGTPYWLRPNEELSEEMAKNKPEPWTENARERARFETLEPDDMLIEVNQYLREKHHYCVYCGEKYSSVEELRDVCPGSSADDH